MHIYKHVHTHVHTSHSNTSLINIRSETVIGIACGIHVLEPVGSLSHGTPVVNLTFVAIVGACANGTTHILCTNGANFAFYTIPNVVIKTASFQGCGEQLQYSARDSVPIATHTCTHTTKRSI